MGWTDISTSRTETALENLFGEAIQLHRQHLLEDVLRSRPVIVGYDSAINYIVEGIILLLFALGIFFGVRSKFFCLSMLSSSSTLPCTSVWDSASTRFTS